MQDELIRYGTNEVPGRAQKKVIEACAERRPQDDILGGCSLETFWGSIEEMERNIRALPEKTAAVLFDQEEEQEIGELVGGMRVITEFADFERVFSRFTLEGQAKEFAKEVMKEGKDHAVRSLAFALSRHLKAGMMLKQWKGKIHRGDSGEDIRDEIKDVMKKFWKEGTAPVLSVAEIRSRREQFKEEIIRLEEEKDRLSGYLKEAAKPLHDRKAAEHLKRKAEAEWEKLYSFLGSSYANDWNKETHKTGYITGFQRMIEMNENELRELNRIEDGALAIEVLFTRLKPMLDDSDLANLWGDVMDYVDPTVQKVYFDALMQWLDELGEIVPQQEEMSLDQRTKKLIERFREAYYLASRPKKGSDQVANVRHVQLILRSIVRFLSSSSRRSVSQVS